MVQPAPRTVLVLCNHGCGTLIRDDGKVLAVSDRNIDWCPNNEANHRHDFRNIGYHLAAMNQKLQIYRKSNARK